MSPEQTRDMLRPVSKRNGPRDKVMLQNAGGGDKVPDRLILGQPAGPAQNFEERRLLPCCRALGNLIESLYQS